MASDKSVRPHGRRAASKEAIKQMHHILSSDDDDVAIVDVQPPPKKKFKIVKRVDLDAGKISLSPAKISNECTLDLECEVEKLSPIQIQYREKISLELKQLESKMESVTKSGKCEIVHSGDFSSLMAIDNENSQTSSINSQQQQSNIVIQPQIPTVNANMPPQSYQLVMDSRSGVIVGALANTTANTPLQIIQPPVTTAPVPSTSGTKKRTSILRQSAASTSATGAAKGGALSKKTLMGPPPPPPPLVTGKISLKSLSQLNNPPPLKTISKKKTQSFTSIMPKGGPPPLTKITANAFPRSVVDLTAEEKADSQEILFSKLQGTTYPSLVVVARPHLGVKDLGIDRPALDAKVKSILMFLPTKFTEWLIQQGLVRSDQKCKRHQFRSMKLGMFSDATKFPNSGGYVWISECCNSEFAQVFDGSIFGGSHQPPMTILKLIYHWCCQTLVHNVTQWVKVDNLFVKNIYALLRSVCTVGNHTHQKLLGGPGIKIQVGLISLGTSPGPNQRQVKVEVLGVMESATKSIRLHAVRPVGNYERNFKRRFYNVLEPLKQWVHPSSTILTDLTVDNTTLHNMGFKTTIQNAVADSVNSNATIMDYLRRVIPRMFQNTLAHLSLSMIQQFLDELVWRETYGTTVLSCFDNIILHLAEQTRFETGETLIYRLRAVSSDPFRNWAIPIQTNSSKLHESQLLAPAPPTTNTKKYNRTKKVNIAPPPPPEKQKQTVEVSKTSKKSSSDNNQLVPLENYYYGTIESTIPHHKVNQMFRCPFCRSSFNDNLTLMVHLFKHAHNVNDRALLCRYCLALVITERDLSKHIQSCHPITSKFDTGYVCLLCETRFMNVNLLGKHMSQHHCPSELPYRCGCCNYRCSNHKTVIDHFYEKHKSGGFLLCPFCLKSFPICNGGRALNNHMINFVSHLQKHQKKNVAKKCEKCNLWFIQKDILKQHQLTMHTTQKGKKGLLSVTANKNCIMAPKSKLEKQHVETDKSKNLLNVIVTLGSSIVCKECKNPMSTIQHYSSYKQCQNDNCEYATCCSFSMRKHNINCQIINSKIPNEELPYEMFCVCGYNDTDGNLMAKHLAYCERKSAYPSLEAAQQATASNSMLDVLGLVRKSETEDKDKNDEVDLKIQIEEPTFDNITQDQINDTLIKHDNSEVEIVNDDNEINMQKENDEITKNGYNNITNVEMETDIELNTEDEDMDTLKSETENIDQMKAVIENTSDSNDTQNETDDKNKANENENKENEDENKTNENMENAKENEDENKTNENMENAKENYNENKENDNESKENDNDGKINDSEDEENNIENKKNENEKKVDEDENETNDENKDNVDNSKEISNIETNVIENVITESNNNSNDLKNNDETLNVDNENLKESIEKEENQTNEVTNNVETKDNVNNLDKISENNLSSNTDIEDNSLVTLNKTEESIDRMLW